jgi:hypothetical protein
VIINFAATHMIEEAVIRQEVVAAALLAGVQVTEEE